MLWGLKLGIIYILGAFGHVFRMWVAGSPHADFQLIAILELLFGTLRADNLVHMPIDYHEVARK